MVETLPTRDHAAGAAASLRVLPRARQRRQAGFDSARQPFIGADVWSAYELGWLNHRGKPQVAIAHLTFPCESTNIIDSRSLQTYLADLSAQVFESVQQVRERLRTDLSEAAWRGAPEQSSIGVRIIGAEQFDAQRIAEPEGLSLDRLDIECSRCTPDPALLQTNLTVAPVTEILTSRLLASRCPVTGRPQPGSVQIRYSGQPIDQERLLQYIVSLRGQSGLREDCLERLFTDIWTRCQPLQLSVEARYTRRGGLEINPFRSSGPAVLPHNCRSARQ